MNQGTPINLTDDQRNELERRVRSQTLDARSVRRARIVLLAADGIGNHEIARRLEISRGQVIAWRGRFARGGVAAIESDLPRSGRKPTIDASEIVRELLAKPGIQGRLYRAERRNGEVQAAISGMMQVTTPTS